MSEASEPFKNAINLSLTERLARAVSAESSGFDGAAFVARVARELAPLELKARVALLARALRDELPPDYPRALAILLATLPAPLPEAKGMFSDAWFVWPIADFVQRYGLEHHAESMAAMEQITQRGTAEFAIRPFLLRYPRETLEILHHWTRHESFHVRRLVSEGTRPRLPWGERLGPFVADPSPVLALLEALRDDPSPYVRRSVANNLNDIAKDHPERVLAVATRWREDATPERRWILERALRSLVKAGHPAALGLIGSSGDAWAITDLQPSAEALQVGESLEIRFTLHNQSDAAHTAVVDYAVEYPRPTGHISRKVFKLKKLEVPAAASVDLRKAHSFRDVSVRTHHPGVHTLTLLVNGAPLAGLTVTLRG